MLIYFVRHADPDYANNCITPLGHLQAQACAQRLVGCGITAVYSSTLGRAQQTADYIGRALDLPVTELDFIPEVVTGLPRVTEGFDRWIEEALGYRREGPYYRCLRETGRATDRPVIVSHGGAIACLIAHFFNVHPMTIIPHVLLRCTGITVFEWHEEKGELFTPRAAIIDDHHHVLGLKVTDADENPQ